jgi:NAD(P)-dependent dehydrogenase (short-subunit alcohol dehydrogenase family)
MNADGLVTLITGGASGIGLALAGEYARGGAHVVIADLPGADPEEQAATLDASLPVRGRVRGRALDVTDRAGFAQLVQQLVDEFGRIDVLVNNAGISLGGPTHEMTPAHWDRIVDVNLGGVVNGILAAYPQMVRQGSGHIVNTASGAGLVAPPFVAGYAATKHAVVGLSIALRAEAALHGVRVSVLCPGAVDTAILDRPPPPDLQAGVSRPVTAREYLEVVHQKPIAAERFARLAVRRIAANQGIIVVPRSAAALWYLHRLSPALTARATAMLARRVDRKLVRPAA